MGYDKAGRGSVCSPSKNLEVEFTLRTRVGGVSVYNLLISLKYPNKIVLTTKTSCLPDCIEIFPEEIFPVHEETA